MDAVEIGVSVGGLLNLTDRFGGRPARRVVPRTPPARHHPRVRIALGHHRASATGSMVAGRHSNHPLIGEFIVIGMGHNHRAVGRRTLGDDHGRGHQVDPLVLGFVILIEKMTLSPSLLH